MSISLEISPANKRAFMALQDAPQNARRGVRQGFFFLGKENVRFLRKEVSKKNKTGRLYRLRRRGRLINHRASSQKEFPARFTGDYNKSLDFEVQGGDTMEFGSKILYGKFLEKGTKKMAARKPLEKTIKATRKDAEIFMSREISKSLGL